LLVRRSSMLPYSNLFIPHIWDFCKKSIESVNDHLKNLYQIEHSRHHSIFNFLVNLMVGLAAYTYLPKKPSLGISPKDLPALPPAVF
ncbi:MAG: hypothetical protein ACYT04_79140, partial [Nostoc sp.]